MSGHWDRPSSPGPEDRDWPAEDFESPSPAQPPSDPWSAEDPWGEAARDDSSAWDVWPPPAPSADDYVIEDPAPPASDPWAESWADDVPGLPSEADGPQGDDKPRSDAVAPPLEPPSYERPRIEPWSGDTDPWGANDVEPWRPAEPWGDEVAPPPVEVSPPVLEPALEPPLELPLEADEPPPASEPTASEPPSVDEAAAPMQPEGEEWPAAEVEPSAPPAPPAPSVDRGPGPIEYFRSIFPSAARDAEVPPESAEPDLEPAVSEEAALAEPAEPAEEAAMAEPVAEAPVAEPAVDTIPTHEALPAPEIPAPPIEPVWEPDLWEPAASEAKPEPEPEREPEPETEPEPPAGTLGDAEAQIGQGAEADSEPESTEATAAPAAADDWQPEPWQHQGESTQVFPASWTPPAPMPDERRILEPESARIRTSLGTEDQPDEADELAAKPSTAEQAVPWLIGVILLLAGMVIVLLALIFAGDGSLGGTGTEASATPVAFVPTSSSDEATPSPSVSGGDSLAPSVSAAPSASAGPQYGGLEMVYQGRSAALAPIYLLHRDFTIDEEPEVFAQDPSLDVRGFAWSPDGTVGAGMYADLLISIEPGKEKRNLGDGIVSVTFGDDASTVYAVRMTEDGANDVATILAIDFESGEQSEIATIHYPRPQIDEESAVLEAQFADDGGLVRLFWTDDNTLRLWSLGAGAWRVDPETGDVADNNDQLPVLWSPGAVRRVTLTFDAGVTTVRLHDGDDEEPVATTTVDGYVSHVRWSPDGEIVSFTVGSPTSGGGVLQDLYAWYLGDGEEPMRLTNTGAAFGAEWLGTTPRWLDQDQ